MWLINVIDYKLEEFHDETQVSYAILSHRWEVEEVNFQLMKAHVDAPARDAMEGWYKILKCCEQAARDGLQYAWADTCCIDKSSSAELQEAINSMWRWYAGATKCYVYLSDVLMVQPQSPDIWLESEIGKGQFCSSQWFTRGWTLQELLAPNVVEFYDSNWAYLGERKQFARLVSEAAGIPKRVLAQNFRVGRACAAEVMSWASRRITTRVEDRAYCLLGLFDVNMPLLYGEGPKAFTRLQEQVLRETNDQSILAWNRASDGSPQSTSPLATSPSQFSDLPRGFEYLPRDRSRRRKASSVSSEGISIELYLKCIAPRLYLGLLNTMIIMPNGETTQIGIYIKRITSQNEQYAIFSSEGNRTHFHEDTGFDFLHNPALSGETKADRKVLTLVNTVEPSELLRLTKSDAAALTISLDAIKFKKKWLSFTRGATYHAQIDFATDQPRPPPLTNSGARPSMNAGSPRDTHAADTNQSHAPSTSATVNISEAFSVKRDVVCQSPPSVAGIIGFQPVRKGFLPRIIWTRGTVAFGFDGHFNPILIVSLQEYRQRDWILFKEIVGVQSGYRVGSGNMPGMHYLDLFGSGQWQTFANNTVFAFKTDTHSRDMDAGFRAHLRPSRLPGTIQLSVRRLRSSEPWLVEVEFDEDPGPFRWQTRLYPVRKWVSPYPG